MKTLAPSFRAGLGAILCCFLCGCSFIRSTPESQDVAQAKSLSVAKGANVPTTQPGRDVTFTHAGFAMWVPSRAQDVWDGPTSSIRIDETTKPGSFVKDDKIVVEIQEINTPTQLRQTARWAASDWYFEYHRALAFHEAQYGIQLRKDIWNTDDTRRLLVTGMVTRSGTYQEDIETAERIIQSIKLAAK
jgi:hypothetical protein